MQPISVLGLCGMHGDQWVQGVVLASFPGLPRFLFLLMGRTRVLQTEEQKEQGWPGNEARVVN